MHHSIQRTVRFHSFFPQNHSSSDFSRPQPPASKANARGKSSSSPHRELNGSSDAQGERPLQLSTLIPRANFYSGNDIHFHSVASTPGSCQPGQLVVLNTGIDDPVEVMAEAMARGAAGILTEQILPVPICQCIVPDVQRAMTRIALAMFGRPEQNLVMIGVVGDAGKTTTAAAITQVMRDIPCRVIAHTGNESAEGIKVEAEWIEQLRRAADDGAAVAVLELQAEAARRGDYDHLHLDVLVITGRNRAKTEFGPSGLRCMIEQVSHSGIIVVGSDDSQALALARSCSSASVITYGVDTDADVSVHTHQLIDGELTALLRNENRSAILQSTLASGTAGAALAAAAAVGVMTENSLVQIAESLGKVRAIPGRFERIWPTDSARLPKIILDMAGTPSRSKRSLAIARRSMQLERNSDRRSLISIPLSKGRKRRADPGDSLPNASKLWCVLTVDLNDSTDTLARFGRALENATDHWVLTCPADQKSKFLTTSHAVLDGVQECASIRLVADQTAAIAWAIRHASDQDTVLILSGGTDGASRQARSERCRALIQDALQTMGNAKPETPSLKIVG